MAGCIRLSCNLITFPVTSAQIIITGYLDERFFNVCNTSAYLYWYMCVYAFLRVKLVDTI